MKKIIVAVFILNTFCIGQNIEKEYNDLIQEILLKREEYKRVFNNSDLTIRDSIIIEARKYLLESITENIFDYWYGTKWDFNGTSRIPKKGKIACGYFVTNVLTDVGFNIPRIKWAQSASEVFIKKLSPNNIKRFSDRPISDIESYLRKTGNGIYLVGLDCHVGFIVVLDKTSHFVHSNYYMPEIGVMSQTINSCNPLNGSKYRIIGKLLSDEMIINWINKIPYD